MTPACEGVPVVIMVDPPNVESRGRLWSHVASDTSFEELHAFAAAVPIPSRGFDRDHYDVPAEHYDAVVSAGAEPVSSRELVARVAAAGLRRRKRSRLSPAALPGAAAPG